MPGGGQDPSRFSTTNTTRAQESPQENLNTLVTNDIVIPESISLAKQELTGMLSNRPWSVMGVGTTPSGLPDTMYQPKHQVGTFLKPQSTMFAGAGNLVDAFGGGFSQERASNAAKTLSRLFGEGSDAGGKASEAASIAGQTTNFGNFARLAVMSLMGMPPAALLAEVMKNPPQVSTPTPTTPQEGGGFGNSGGDDHDDNHGFGGFGDDTSEADNPGSTGGGGGNGGPSGGPSGGSGTGGAPGGSAAGGI